MSPHSGASGVPSTPPRETLDEAVARCRAADLVHLLLDYDGTLVPLAPTPQAAQPDAELMALVARLGRSPRIDLHFVSGRTREDLAGWFGACGASLWAEHGFWHRAPGGRVWRAVLPHPGTSLSAVAHVLEDSVARTPGSWVERKSASMAWHYRQAPPELGLRRARELRAALAGSLERLGLDVLDGHKVVEVRRAGAGKAVVARALRKCDAVRHAILALGDDKTDDEMLAALPAGAVTVSVGSALPHARFRVATPREARALIASLLRP